MNTGFTDRIWDMDDWESGLLLKGLFDKIAYAVEFQCRMRRKPNTVTFWGNGAATVVRAVDSQPWLAVSALLVALGFAIRRTHRHTST